MRKSVFSKGFTLVEILVVIAIIGILSAIVYVNLADIRNEAQNRAVRAQLKSIKVALELYKAEYGRYPKSAENGKSLCTDDTPVGTPDSVLTSQFTWAFSDTLVLPPLSLEGCGDTPIIDNSNDFTPDYIGNQINKELQKISGNPDCRFVYSVDATDGSFYKLSALQCHAGTNERRSLSDWYDELAICPDRCDGYCFRALGADKITVDQQMQNAGIEDWRFNSYAIYSAGGQCI